MGLENLKQNIQMEKEILRELLVTNSQLQNLYNLYPYEKREIERKLLVKALNALTEQLRIINNSIPELLNAVSPFKSLGTDEPVKNLVKITYGTTEKISVTIEQKSRESFLNQLSVSRETLKRLKDEKEKKVMKSEFMEFRKAGAYAKLANRLFLNLSNKLIDKGYFLKLNVNLRKSNMPYLLVTYLSMAMLSTLIGLIAGIAGFFVMMFIYPEYLLESMLLIPGVPLLTFGSYYIYPIAERRSIAGKINQEIPFVTINMSAIAGSGIEPSQIFKIIALGEEYSHTRTELKKIINQINVYGYDLVTALKNTARETSSRKLSELLNGMAAAISGGSELPSFLDKRSETLLFEYKLEKEKKTKAAETFMDIYISLMIAAPMIMTLLLVLIVVSNISIGMSLQTLTIIILSVVALINLFFLMFLQLSGDEE